jgi:hypothetical protein
MEANDQRRLEQLRLRALDRMDHAITIPYGPKKSKYAIRIYRNLTKFEKIKEMLHTVFIVFCHWKA